MKFVFFYEKCIDPFFRGLCWLMYTFHLMTHPLFLISFFPRITIRFTVIVDTYISLISTELKTIFCVRASFATLLYIYYNTHCVTD